MEAPSRSSTERPRARRRRSLRIGFAAVIVLGLMLGLSRLGEPIAHGVLDTQLRLSAQWFPRTAAREVVVIGIDEATRDALQVPIALWHEPFGRLLEALALARPLAIGLDVLLPERSYDALIPGQDLRLMRGIVAARAVAPVVAGRGIDAEGRARPLLPALASLLGADGVGYILLPVDADGTVRRFSEALGSDGKPAPTLAGSIARRIGVPVRAGLIDYTLRPTAPVSMKMVLDWHAAGDAAALRSAFGGKLVLLGSLARFEDRLRQPVDLAPWEAYNDRRVPGVLIHAQILRGLADRGLVASAPMLVIVALTLLGALLWWLPVRGRAVVALALGVPAALYVAGVLLLGRGLHVDVFAPMLVAFAAVSGRWMVEAGLHLGERRALRRTFSGYVGPQLLREILSGRVDSELRGELRTVAVMFADMRGFTTTSAALAPTQVITLLNRYYERVAAVIHGEGGMLNSLMGDGFMATFGAPKAMANPAANAFAAGRRLIAMLPALNAELAADGLPAVSIGVGIHLGEAVVGHVGSRARHEYSAIGDTTNVAARLEQLTKDLGVPMVCSHAVAAALGFPAALRTLGTHTIRGRGDLEVFGLTEDALR
ncbi:MAG: adenylate/guanylate cyclase domain-containing protein [Burkholderiales bacterium]|nr:adenylate/guanylate cyclase domain-containing protein [Burkholderiales bacterium]